MSRGSGPDDDNLGGILRQRRVRTEDAHVRETPGVPRARGRGTPGRRPRTVSRDGLAVQPKRAGISSAASSVEDSAIIGPDGSPRATLGAASTPPSETERARATMKTLLHRASLAGAHCVFHEMESLRADARAVAKQAGIEDEYEAQEQARAEYGRASARAHAEAEPARARAQVQRLRERAGWAGAFGMQEQSAALEEEARALEAQAHARDPESTRAAAKPDARTYSAPASPAASVPYRGEMEQIFGESFTGVEVALGDGRLAPATGAQAAAGDEAIAFASATPSRAQVAHELTHVVQRRRAAAGSRATSAPDDASEIEASAIARRVSSAGPAPARVHVAAAPSAQVHFQHAPDEAEVANDAEAAATTIYEAFRGSLFSEDEEGALDQLRGRSSASIRQIREAYSSSYKRKLEDEFTSYSSDDQAAEALALLWPTMTVLERLSMQVGWNDDEDGIQQVIDSASDAELRAARPGIQRYLDELDVTDHYRARQRVWPEKSVENVLWLLRKGDGWLWDDEGPAATAILSLTPIQRATLWNDHSDAFSMFNNAEKARIRRMCIGEDGAPATEAETLKARMELATKGPGTDEDGVAAAIGIAASRRDELARIDAALASGRADDGTALSPAARTAFQRRRDEIGDVESLLTVSPGEGGRLDEASFLGRVQGDMDSGTVDAALATARADAFTRAKQALLATIGTLGVDENAALAVLRDIQGEVDLADGETLESLAPAEVARRQQTSAEALRQKLRDDRELEPVWSALDDEETAYADALTEGETYDAAIYELTEAFEGVDTDEAAILRIICGMSETDRERLRTKTPPILVRIRGWGLGANVYRALDAALETGRIPTDVALDAAYVGWGTDESLASDALANLSENERATYRRGYLLVHRSADAELSAEDRLAADAYNRLHERMDSEYNDEELDRAIAALIGLPTLAELQSAQGRVDAATIMLERQRERLAMSGGLTDALTTADDTASFAHVEFRARYQQAMAAEGISLEEFAVLVALDEQFNRRFQSYADTVNLVSEIAGTVAAVVAGMVVVVASGGTAVAAAPGFFAWLRREQRAHRDLGAHGRARAGSRVGGHGRRLQPGRGRRRSAPGAGRRAQRRADDRGRRAGRKSRSHGRPVRPRAHGADRALGRRRDRDVRARSRVRARRADRPDRWLARRRRRRSGHDAHRRRDVEAIGLGRAGAGRTGAAARRPGRRGRRRGRRRAPRDGAGAAAGPGDS